MTGFACDRSDLARLRASGKDVLDLLHRLSTQDLKGLPVGSGAATVLTSPKGRIVERLFVHRLADRDVRIVAGDAERVLAHLRRYTFAEDVGATDVTSETRQLALFGDAASLVPDPGAWGILETEIGGARVLVLGEDGFGSDGRSVVAAAADAERVRAAIGAPRIDREALEAWRVERGIPAPGSELNESWNPLEAGLRDHVSFTKGCYVGQEVVARLSTYDKVSRGIVVLRVPEGKVAPGADVVAGGREVGKVTSVAGGHAMAYVKLRDFAADAEVTVGGVAAEVRR